jgi:hypothetical protein
MAHAGILSTGARFVNENPSCNSIPCSSWAVKRLRMWVGISV